MDPLTLSLLFILGAASVDQIQEPTPLQREELIRKILTSDIAEIRAAFFDHNSSHMGTSLAFKVKVLSDHRVLDHIRALNSLTAHGREINARVARGDDRERRLNACRPVPLISEQLEFDDDDLELEDLELESKRISQ